MKSKRVEASTDILKGVMASTLPHRIAATEDVAKTVVFERYIMKRARALKKETGSLQVAFQPHCRGCCSAFPKKIRHVKFH